MRRRWLLVSLLSVLFLHNLAVYGQTPPRLQFFAGYSYSSVAFHERHGFQGAQGNLKLNLSPATGIVADAGGQYRSDPSVVPPPDISFLNFHDRYAHVYQALIGPEFTKRGSRFDVFGHALVGVLHGAQREPTHNFLAIGLGGGGIVHGSKGPGLRFQADYLPNRGGGESYNDVRFGIGLVFTILK